MGFKNMNKKGLELKSAFYAVIIVGLVISMTGIIVNAWNDKYSSGLIYDLEVYNELDSISGTAGGQQSALGAQSSDTGSDSESSTFRRVYGIVTNIFAPFRVVFGNNGMIDAVTERFGLPDIVRQAVVTMMVIAFTFALVAIIFRRARA